MNADVDTLLATRFAATFDSTNSQDWADVRRRLPVRRRTRRRILFAAVGLAAALAVPAIAAVVGPLNFWNASHAPAPVVLEFQQMNLGAPEGMSPQAIADETRMIGAFVFGGASHILWVAPTNEGGFCFEWMNGWGGCKNMASDQLTWNGDLVIPDDVRSTVPAQPSPQEAIKLHDSAVPRWITGYVTNAATRSVAVKFVGGTVSHPTVFWVSAPINAGFFSYDVPASEQTSRNHVLTVEALDSAGKVIAAQPLH